MSAEADVLAELHADAARVATVRADVDKYTHEQEEIQAEARSLEKESKEELTRHEWFASIVTFLQVAIGLSAIGALIESRKVWLASLVAYRIALCIELAIALSISNPYLAPVKFVWHVIQNAILLAWSFTSRSGCAEECGWWQDRQFTGLRTLFRSEGSITSLTGCFSVGWPRPYLIGRSGTLRK